jgi:hypothetical protein
MYHYSEYDYIRSQCAGLESVRIIDLDAPPFDLLGSEFHLSCYYDLEDDKLYT